MVSMRGNLWVISGGTTHPDVVVQELHETGGEIWVLRQEVGPLWRSAGIALGQIVGDRFVNFARAEVSDRGEVADNGRQRIQPDRCLDIRQRLLLIPHA